MPFAGGPATKVSGISGYSLAVSPDGSKLLFDTWTVPGRRYGLTFLDLDRGRERFTPVPFAKDGGIFGYAWSPASRQVALVGGPIMDSETFPEQLFLLELASGRWRTAVSFDAAKGPAPVAGELGLAWPAPRRVTFVARTGSDTAAGSYRLVGVDPPDRQADPVGGAGQRPQLHLAVAAGLPRLRRPGPVPALQRGRGQPEHPLARGRGTGQGEPVLRPVGQADPRLQGWRLVAPAAVRRA